MQRTAIDVSHLNDGSILHKQGDEEILIKEGRAVQESSGIGARNWPGRRARNRSTISELVLNISRGRIWAKELGTKEELGERKEELSRKEGVLRFDGGQFGDRRSIGSKRSGSSSSIIDSREESEKQQGQESSAIAGAGEGFISSSRGAIRMGTAALAPDSICGRARDSSRMGELYLALWSDIWHFGAALDRAS